MFMVTDKNTVRCISSKANFKPTRNIPNHVAILYCALVYLSPGIRSRALWGQNVNTYNKTGTMGQKHAMAILFYR